MLVYKKLVYSWVHFCWMVLLPIAGIHCQVKLTYYQNVKPIVDRKCIICHRKGQAAPFPLTSYLDLYKRSDFIKMAVETRYMPPWHADTSYQTFFNQVVLTPAEIVTIVNWVNQGALEGNQTDETLLQEKQSGVELPEPEVRFSMNRVFNIPGDNTEQYRVFVIPTHTTEERFVRGIDFVPGNKKLAHHARVMLDTSHLLRPDDGIQVGASSALQKYSVKLAKTFWYGWLPGNFPIFYPPGVAKRLPKGADIVLNMHYAPSPKPETDSSTLSIYWSKEPPRRLVQTLILDENWITNQPFLIPPDTLITFYVRSPLLPYDVSLLSIVPHMHLLGKSFKAFAITPDGDFVPLVHIPEWEFNWQRTYQFEKLIKLPKNSVIYAEVQYDNTRLNKRNPNTPPKEVRYGWATNQEMMNLIIDYLEYQPGDESLILYPHK